ncbi:MAG: cation transporter, partial [Chloroflexota bacterium]|nr:cation transporter [Chloroflexota bacterium]
MALESATPTPSLAPRTPNDPERDGRDGPAEWQSATRTRSVRRILIDVLGLNLAVAAVKLGYGLTIGSVAMSADGVQSLLDGLANVVGLVGIAIAAR